MRTYSEVDLGIESLVGRTVNSAFVNADKDAVILNTEDGPYYLRWSGDCCAECFIAHINGANLLVGSTILEVENSEWTDISRDDDYAVLESLGTKFKTSKGYVDIETRLDHNGYYSGKIAISKVGFVDIYSCLEVIEDCNIPLEDF